MYCLRNVVFIRCTCDPCPKKCNKCCRKRIACDSLPDEECDTDGAPAMKSSSVMSSEEDIYDADDDWSTIESQSMQKVSQQERCGDNDMSDEMSMDESICSVSVSCVY